MEKHNANKACKEDRQETRPVDMAVHLYHHRRPLDE